MILYTNEMTIFSSDPPKYWYFHWNRPVQSMCLTWKVEIFTFTEIFTSSSAERVFLSTKTYLPKKCIWKIMKGNKFSTSNSNLLFLVFTFLDSSKVYLLRYLPPVSNQPTRHFQGLLISKVRPRSSSVALRQLNPIHKNGP